MADQRLRFLVLGANGFLGGHVARLIESGFGEGIFVARRRPHPTAPGEWEEFDVVQESERALGRLLERHRPDAVVNCVGATTGSPGELKRVNLLATSRLVSALAQGSGTHLVQLGSAAEYGPSETLAPVHETTRARPASDYGATKLAATELVAEAVGNGQISATVLRVFNPIGAGAPGWSLVGHAVLALREASRSGAPSVVLGRLDSSRDFIDARDVARAVLAAASRRGRSAEVPVILNVGRGIPVSTRWIVRRLARIAHFEGEIIEHDESSRRSDLVVSQWADTTAARVSLGWVPRYLLSEALVEAWTLRPLPSPAELHVTPPDPTCFEMPSPPKRLQVPPPGLDLQPQGATTRYHSSV